MFTYDMPDGYTFDDVLLLPGASSFLPGEADVATRLSRRVTLNLSLIHISEPTRPY